MPLYERLRCEAVNESQIAKPAMLVRQASGPIEGVRQWRTRRPGDVEENRSVTNMRRFHNSGADSFNPDLRLTSPAPPKLTSGALAQSELMPKVSLQVIGAGTAL